MDTLGPIISVQIIKMSRLSRCPDYQGVLIIKVSLYDKAPFGTVTKCVDYAGVLFSSTQVFVMISYHEHA